MKKVNENIREYYETLVQNAQAGASYYLKLRNNPVTYQAIPLISADNGDKSKGMFTFRVVEPASYRGTFEKPIEEIEKLERKND